MVLGQHRLQEETSLDLERKGNDIMWCCLSQEELEKCLALSRATSEDHTKDEFAFGSYFRRIKCKLYSNKDECMRLIDENHVRNPNLISVDAGEVFVGGRYHSLVPILREVYDQGENFYHSVAVIKKGSLLGVQTLADLRGLRACFPKVKVVPIEFLNVYYVRLITH